MPLSSRMGRWFIVRQRVKFLILDYSEFGKNVEKNHQLLDFRKKAEKSGFELIGPPIYFSTERALFERCDTFYSTLMCSVIRLYYSMKIIIAMHRKGPWYIHTACTGTLFICGAKQQSFTGRMSNPGSSKKREQQL